MRQGTVVKQSFKGREKLDGQEAADSRCSGPCRRGDAARGNRPGKASLAGLATGEAGWIQVEAIFLRSVAAIA